MEKSMQSVGVVVFLLKNVMHHFQYISTQHKSTKVNIDILPVVID